MATQGEITIDYNVVKDTDGTIYIERVRYRHDNGVRTYAGSRVCGPRDGFTSFADAHAYKVRKGWDRR